MRKGVGMGKGLDKRTLRWRNLPDAWVDWWDGTLNFREALFMLGVIKGKPCKVVLPLDNVDRETALCSIRIRHDTARRLTELAEALGEPGPLALAGRLLDEALSFTWTPFMFDNEQDVLMEVHGRLQYRSKHSVSEGWSSSVTAW